jgi:hypothetical protein
MTSLGPISTVITENRGSNVRILADTIQLQTWGMSATNGTGGGLTAYNPTSNVAAMTISGSNISIFGDVRVDGEFYDGYGGLRTFGAAVNWATCNIAAPIAFPTGAAFAYSGSNGTYRYSGNEIIYNVRIDGRLTSAATTVTDDFELVLPFPVKDNFYLPGTGIGDLRLTILTGTTSNAFQVCPRTNAANGGRATLKVLSGTAEVPMGGIAVNSVLSLTGNLTYATSVNSTGFTSVFKNAFQDTVTGNVGFGTRAPRSTMHVNGDIMFTGALRDADSNAIWAGINVRWYPTQTPPTLNMPTGAAFTTSSTSGTYRYVGNDITYNASIAGTLTTVATTQTDDFTLSVPYPVKIAGYATNTIVGDFWLTVATTAYTNTYTAYARTLSTNPNVVVIRYLSGTSDDSLAKFPAGAVMTLQGTMNFQTTLVNNDTPMPATYIPANLYQDQLGNVMIKGSNVAPYLPRGQLDVIGSNVDVGLAGLVVDQIGSGKVAVFKKNAVDKVTIDENGDVGIGTSNPINPLHISNRSGIRIDDASSNIFLLRQLNNSIFGGEYSHITPFNTTTNTIQQLIVDGLPVLINPLSGNVGIGTTNPQAKLHVDGDVRVKSSILNNAGRIMVNQTSCVLQNITTSLPGGNGIVTTTATQIMSLSITPSSTSSKILIIATMNGHRNAGTGYAVGYVRRGTTIISSEFMDDIGNVMGNGETTCSAVVILDSPSTTSAVLYNVYISPNNTDQFRWRNGSMNLQEIAG